MEKIEDDEIIYITKKNLKKMKKMLKEKYGVKEMEVDKHVKQ